MVQQRPQRFGLFGPKCRRAQALGPGGAFAQRRQAVRVEGVQGIEHRLVVAAQLRGDSRRSLAPSAGKQDLAAA